MGPEKRKTKKPAWKLQEVNGINNTQQTDNETIQKIMKVIESDHTVQTDAKFNVFRRTVTVNRGKSQKFGFTLQTYVFDAGEDTPLDCITYVDYVEINSCAAEAGIRPGDIILSINGENVTDYPHEKIVELIDQCLTMRLVLIFENCISKIDYQCRLIRLEMLLASKLAELNATEAEESRLLRKHSTLHVYRF